MSQCYGTHKKKKKNCERQLNSCLEKTLRKIIRDQIEQADVERLMRDKPNNPQQESIVCHTRVMLPFSLRY